MTKIGILIIILGGATAGYLEAAYWLADGCSNFLSDMFLGEELPKLEQSSSEKIDKSKLSTMVEEQKSQSDLNKVDVSSTEQAQASFDFSKRNLFKFGATASIFWIYIYHFVSAVRIYAPAFIKGFLGL